MSDERKATYTLRWQLNGVYQSQPFAVGGNLEPLMQHVNEQYQALKVQYADVTGWRIEAHIRKNDTDIVTVIAEGG